MNAKPSLPDLDALCAAHFGFAELRPFQREAIDALLAHGEGGRVLLVAPTGGGKSLCYQLPALALPGTALVVSPLVALMEDQVRGLAARGIPATFFASTLSAEENGRRLAALRRGAFKLVYAAPERLGHAGLGAALAAAGTSLVAIDEAHCIVQWGHDFRPDYLRIGETLAARGPTRMIACTATATRAARGEIMRRLGWDPRKVVTVLRGFFRPNLTLRVVRARAPREVLAEVRRALAEALAGPGAGIVYTATRKSAEALAAALREDGWDAPVYHGGTAAPERARISAEFAARETRVLVATNAFGMGVDRPDVRIVVHAETPGSLEAYYQEVGRAGRDGLDARGLLLVTPKDLALRRRLCRLGPDGAPATRAEAARALGRLAELVRYIDGKTCRHRILLRHFGDDPRVIDGGCGRCDVCVEAAPPDTVRDPPRFEDTPEAPPKAPKDGPAPSKPRPIAAPAGVPAELLEALRRYRRARALSLGVPAYVVAPNRALVEMAMLRPASAEELLGVRGMGKGRVAAHGHGFLRVIGGEAVEA
ncbi:RecQ family ATP-dependent DNA helicase [Polyangium sorediatum]|uniref:ATP-dependent DNA helicase RecQ n=1 Tax=Polyangium sorediatum TaxID=889274 RepID=A0ABT6NVU0_9BACT|nr:RecQ family ATP-dependent DNA helicase [Polyangium sorediatum]MDI1432409.1 RecQ family ATP-dependent DNA helicase [Polyangium sorediatum]